MNTIITSLMPIGRLLWIHVAPSRRISLALWVILILADGDCRAAPEPALPLQEKALKITHRILPDCFVQKVAFNDRGQAWIGTFRQGLIHWDRNVFHWFSPTNSDFPETHLWDLTTDKSRDLWVGTSAGLIRVNEAGKMQKYDSANSPMPGNPVFSLAVDSSNRVWAACGSAGKSALLSFDGHVWNVWTAKELKTAFSFVKRVTVDAQGNIWAALFRSAGDTLMVRIGNRGCDLFGPEHWGFPLYDCGGLLAGGNDRFILVDYSLSSATADHPPQLIQYHSQGWRAIAPPGSSRSDWTCLKGYCLDGNGTFWVANNRGLWGYDGKKWTHAVIPELAEAVFSLAYDSPSGLWLCTGKGIYIADVR
jgi:ligand-binding sensor domain-containing protein